MPSQKRAASAAITPREAALMQISTSLATLQRGFRAAVDKAVAHTGLSQALAGPLVMIGRHGDGLRPGVLAALLGIEGPSLVRSLAQLADAGYVEFREDAVDGRAKTVCLTPAGIAARQKVEAALNVLRASMYEGIPDDDVAACLRVFAALEQRIGRKGLPTLGRAPPVAAASAPVARPARKLAAKATARPRKS